LFASLALASCVFSMSSLTSDPLAPITEQEWTLEAARHLLDRAGFGGTPDEVLALHALGPEGAVESMLGVADEVGGFDATLIVGREARKRARAASGDDRKEARKEMRREDKQQAAAFRRWWIEEMIATEEPLREKMALFWHGYFTSSQREVRNSYSMVQQIELYRRAGLGSFDALLRAASKEPAMLAYLNNDKNKKGNPNENFAREVMELFTMGPGHYSEQDIKEAARAFTGWTSRDGEFRAVRRRHDRDQKTLLGRTGRFDGDDVLDIILEQDATSPFVARKVFTFFAHREPDESLVDALADRFRASGHDLRDLLRAIFLSREFHSARSHGAQFKSPVEFIVSTVRRLECEPPPSEFLVLACERLGQGLLLPPTVKGWDGGEAWITTSTILVRANVARVLVHSLQGTMLVDVKRDKAASRGDAFAKALRKMRKWRPRLDVVELTGDAQTSREAVVALCNRLLPVAPFESTVQELQQWAAPYGDDAFDLRDPEQRERVLDVVHLVLSLPEYQLN